MEITFYYAPMSSAVPVSSALAELDVPHRRETIVLGEGSKAPEFLRINPNGKVPVLVVDGTPMFEALAITQWLGDHFGVTRGLWPAANTAERLPALAWSTWTFTEYACYTSAYSLATSDRAPKELRSGAWADYAKGQLHQLLGILEEQLRRGSYLLGDRFSLADLVASSCVLWSEFCGISTADFPHVSEWLKSCKSRPTIAREFGL